MEAAELKHKIRQLKSLELRIRYGIQDGHSGESGKGRKQGRHSLLWDEFFDLSGDGQKKARYTLEQLLRMDREQYKSIVNEFFFRVYYLIYQEKGIAGCNLYEPELLQQLGLPYDADSFAVKKRFRELAKQHHPDTGGDSEEFIKLMELYQEMKPPKESSGK